MKRWAWLLVAPYVVVKSSFTEHCADLGTERYQVRPSTVCFYDEDVDRYYSLGTAEDVAEALNEAHDRRTSVPWGDGPGIFHFPVNTQQLPAENKNEHLNH